MSLSVAPPTSFALPSPMSCVTLTILLLLSRLDSTGMSTTLFQYRCSCSQAYGVMPAMADSSFLSLLQYDTKLLMLEKV